MSTIVKEDRNKRRPRLPKPSSRVFGSHGVSSRHLTSGSFTEDKFHRHFSLGGGGSKDEKSVTQQRHAVRVLDEEGNDVTPQPLYQADPGAGQTDDTWVFMDELSAEPASEQASSSGSINAPFSRSLFCSSRLSSRSTAESPNEEMEDTFSKQEQPIYIPYVKGKRDTVKEQVTEEMLKEVIDVFLTETDTISLLDLPSMFVSVDDDDAETIIERNKQYVDLCRNKLGNDKYMDRSAQTLNGAAKTKHTQTDSLVMVDTAATVTAWDMYDTFYCPELNDSVHDPESEKSDHPEAAMDTGRTAETSVSVGSTVSTASVDSMLKEVEVTGSSVNAESDVQLLMLSENFRHSLLVMERTIVRNNFQTELAAYRQLPGLDDNVQGPETEIQEDTDGDRSPALERLWSFSCELSRGRSVSSMAWNKRNLDILAVGYGELDSTNQKPGLVCCWSIKNLMWPEFVIHCDSAVTSLDFSTTSPSQLAVGMYDGTISIYNVQSQENMHVISSSKCPNKHLAPVSQLRWTQQELNTTGEEKTEALFSVSADGRISKWFIFNKALDCIDLMELKRIHKTKKKSGGDETESVLSTLISGLCFDFHPTDSSLYLVGTWQGLIHKCSCSNSWQSLDTFKKHCCPVNSITWSPHSPEVFLSCSSDWTIQLWTHDRLKPLFSFTSTQTTVCDVKWSPKWATVFGAVNEAQLEIWDMNSSVLDPVAVQPADPGVKMKTLLFASQTDCVLVGDSSGRVTVYLLKNLTMGENNQVNTLGRLVSSAASRQM